MKFRNLYFFPHFISCNGTTVPKFPWNTSVAINTRIFPDLYSYLLSVAITSAPRLSNDFLTIFLVTRFIFFEFNGKRRETFIQSKTKLPNGRKKKIYRRERKKCRKIKNKNHWQMILQTSDSPHTIARETFFASTTPCLLCKTFKKISQLSWIILIKFEINIKIHTFANCKIFRANSVARENIRSHIKFYDKYKIF